MYLTVSGLRRQHSTQIELPHYIQMDVLLSVTRCTEFWGSLCHNKTKLHCLDRLHEQ